MAVKKIALIIGHDEKAQGAVAYNGMSEYKFNSFVTSYAKEYAPAEITARIFNRNKGGIRVALQEAKDWGADASIEFHFNWNETVVKKQLEILVYKKSIDSQAFAKKLASAINKKMGISLRGDDSNGLKIVVDGERGADNVIYGNSIGIKYCMLIEPCFGNIKTEESCKIIENPKLYAKVVIEAMSEIINDALPINSSDPVGKATFKGLVEAYRKADIEFPNLKAITLAQWMLETGRVTSKLSIENFNFGGLKFREFNHGVEGVSKVVYRACDGIDEYFKCKNYEAFIKLYWKFLDRSPYEGWRKIANDPIEFINYLAMSGKYKNRKGGSYCPRKGYADDIIKLLPEATKFLGG